MDCRDTWARSAALVLGLLPVVVILIGWTLITRGIPEERIIGPTILPSPSEVIASLNDLVTTSDNENRTLFTHIWISMRRVGLGFLLALAIVMPLGILMGSFGSVRALFDPVMTASQKSRRGHDMLPGRARRGMKTASQVDAGCQTAPGFCPCASQQPRPAAGAYIPGLKNARCGFQLRKSS